MRQPRLIGARVYRSLDRRSSRVDVSLKRLELELVERVERDPGRRRETNLNDDARRVEILERFGVALREKRLRVDP